MKDKLISKSKNIYELPQEGKMKVPGRIYSSESLLSHPGMDSAIQQVSNVAELPGIVDASMAMPDIHWGYGFPIGGVAAMDPKEGGVISPGGIGFDVNCGMRLITTKTRYLIFPSSMFVLVMRVSRFCFLVKIDKKYLHIQLFNFYLESLY